MEPNYRELSDKIERVKDDIGGHIQQLAVEVGKLGVTITTGLAGMQDMKTDISTVKDLATRAKDSTDSAHKRIDALRPVSEANLVERVKSLETTVRWVATLIIGAVVLAVLGVVLVNNK